MDVFNLCKSSGTELLHCISNELMYMYQRYVNFHEFVLLTSFLISLSVNDGKRVIIHVHARVHRSYEHTLLQ